jgi:hypothetical protein
MASSILNHMRPRPLPTLIAALALALPALAQAPVVTDDKWVEYHKSKILLRQINGRWWTPDNRQVYPPGKDGFWWEIDSKLGVCTFHHHRPFDVTRGESLHLWMTPDQVEGMFGQPNREFGERGQGFWYYYGVDGTALELRFMEGELGEAWYEKHTSKRSVESIAHELGGRSIYKVKAERATEKSKESLRQRIEAQHAAHARPSRGPQPTITVVHTAEASPPANSEPTPAPITAEALASVKIGAARDDVLRALGKPASRMAIASADGETEDFEYQLKDGRKVVITLLDGKVMRLP